eukprot:5747576-Pleurochrysis_carterae.AAC.1
MLANSLTQEACLVQAAAKAMHDGNYAGHVAVVLLTILLQRLSEARQVARIICVAQLLRCSRKQLLLEFMDEYADAEGRSLTVAELVVKEEKF